MDEFAQSREDNDLFADEFELASQPVVIEETAQANAELQVPPTSRIETSHPRGGRESGKGGRRGRGGGIGIQGQGDQGRQGNLTSSRQAPQNEQPAVDRSENGRDTNENAAAQDGEGSAPPVQPAAHMYRGPAAVRGDRSATGGPAHKKLTEEELSEKMAKMKVINAHKAERFRLSEADSAAFAQKEQEIKKRVKEQKNSRAMDMERAQNRKRKMKAQGGREWDSEKLESDIVDGKSRGRSSQYVRGGFGGVIGGADDGLAGSRYAGEEELLEDNDQAFGYRGGSRRGRGRGSRGAQRGRGDEAQAAPLGPEDFPSLPPSVSKPASSKATNSEPTPNATDRGSTVNTTQTNMKGSESTPTQPVNHSVDQTYTAPTDAKPKNASSTTQASDTETPKTTDICSTRSDSRPPTLRSKSNWAEEMATTTENKKGSDS